jgi:hypothetical protein
MMTRMEPTLFHLLQRAEEIGPQQARSDTGHPCDEIVLDIRDEAPLEFPKASQACSIRSGGAELQRFTDGTTAAPEC